MIDPIEKIKKVYEDSIIEELFCPIPDLRVVSVYEKEWEAEDPLIPDYWFIDSEHNTTREINLSKVVYTPKNLEIAKDTAKLFINILNGDLEVRVQQISIIEDQLPSMINMEIVAEISSMHPMFDENEWNSINYSIQVQ